MPKEELRKEELIETDPKELIAQSNIRKQFPRGPMESLASSMDEIDLLHPIRCRRVHGKLEIVDGARRCMAAIELGWTKVPVIVDDQDIDQAGLIQRQLIANCQREDLLPSEQAKAIRDFMAHSKSTGSETAKKLGMVASSISKLLPILSLPEQVIQWVDQRLLPLTAAYELSKLKSPEEQLTAARKLVEGKQAKSTAKERSDQSSDAKESKGVSRPMRTQLTLSGERVVTVAGPQIDMQVVMEMLLELAALLKKEMKRGVAIDTFAKLLRDQAQLSLSKALED